MTDPFDSEPPEGWRHRLFESAATPMMIVDRGGAIHDRNPAADRWIEADRVGDLADGPSDLPALRAALDRVGTGHDADVAMSSGTTLSFRPLPNAILVERTSAATERPDPSAERTLTGRTALATLVGHLDLLRTTGLSEMQRTRVEAAIGTAADLTRHFGESADDDSLTDDGLAEPLPALANRRVLVVDDDEVNRYLLNDMLAVLGVDATAVGDAETALASLDGDPFDVILMDVMLPGLDGIEATRRIRERPGPQPTIVGLTALPEARQRCLDAGMDAFTTKPIRLNVLSAMLAHD